MGCLAAVACVQSASPVPYRRFQRAQAVPSVQGTVPPASWKQYAADTSHAASRVVVGGATESPAAAPAPVSVSDISR